jgi:hypothetical protein
MSLMKAPRTLVRSDVRQGVAAGRRPRVARRNACALPNPALRAKDQPIKTVAHDGTVTFTTYDAKGRETEQASFPASSASSTTRPALSLATSVISSRWHTTFNLLTKRAEPGKFTVWAYANDTGNLTAQSETMTTDATGAATFSPTQKPNTAIKSTGWAYHATTQLPTTIVERETAFGATAAVEKERTTYKYRTTGDVSEFTSSVGGRTQLIETNADGRVISAVLSNGKTLQMQLDRRGRLLKRTLSGDNIDIVRKPDGRVSSITREGFSSVNLAYAPNDEIIDLTAPLQATSLIVKTDFLATNGAQATPQATTGTVQFCCRKAEIIGGFVSHCWIRTSQKNAGMASNPKCRANVGDNYEAPFITEVYISDHSCETPDKCTDVPAHWNVDETCVNRELQIGKEIGRFSPWNNCQTFATHLVFSCARPAPKKP